MLMKNIGSQEMDFAPYAMKNHSIKKQRRNDNSVRNDSTRTH